MSLLKRIKGKKKNTKNKLNILSCVEQNISYPFNVQSLCKFHIHFFQRHIFDILSDLYRNFGPPNEHQTYPGWKFKLLLTTKCNLSQLNKQYILLTILDFKPLLGIHYDFKNTKYDLFHWFYSSLVRLHKYGTLVWVNCGVKISLSAVSVIGLYLSACPEAEVFVTTS